MDHAFLTFTIGEAWATLRQQLAGISDQEFFWEPTPNCWQIRQADSGLWTYDYQMPPPQPAPMTTIGWRIVHLAACKIIYYDYAFGPGKLTFPELVIPHTAANAVTWLEQGHALLTSALAAYTDATLEQPKRTNWGEMLPAWRIFWILISHDLQHGAEIGCLRDLYRLQPSTAD
ncbi:DinB family protein [soil metagenome]